MDSPDEALNPVDKIHIKTFDEIEIFGRNQESIEFRLEQLSEEWELERFCEFTIASLSLLGILLALLLHFSWLLLTVSILLLSMAHALYDRPSFMFYYFRRKGKRTRKEIEEERHALKALRGDYQSILDPADALQSAMKE